MFEQAPHHHFNLLDSTNNYASTIAKLPETINGTAITADFQENGRGQRDNKWLAPAGSAFLGTLVLKVNIRPENIFFLSKWCAILVSSTLKNFIKQDINIKWPNDVFVEGKKIGGILIENTWSENQLLHSLLGIGINFSSSPLENATSIGQLNATIPSTQEFLHSLRLKMNELFFLLEGNLHSEIDELYHSMLFQKNETRNYKIAQSQETFSGKIIQVEADGKLIIEKEDQSKLGFYMKEVIFI
jgi:BirA family biotin operon repressor/biotin-[acetyl-CoA-carboxylase] ligase